MSKRQSDPTSQEIFYARGALNPIYGLLDRHRLTAAQRRPLHGSLFPEAPRVVHSVAHALRTEPELFTRFREDPDALAELQRRAEEWRDLCSVLEDLLGLAWDRYLLAQGQATRRATEVVQTVRREDDSQEEDPTEKSARLLALAVADQLLKARATTRTDKARRTRKERRKVAAD